jgi:hypothetical protein
MGAPTGAGAVNDTALTSPRVGIGGRSGSAVNCGVGAGPYRLSGVDEGAGDGFGLGIAGAAGTECGIDVEGAAAEGAGAEGVGMATAGGADGTDGDTEGAGGSGGKDDPCGAAAGVAPVLNDGKTCGRVGTTFGFAGGGGATDVCSGGLAGGANWMDTPFHRHSVVYLEAIALPALVVRRLFGDDHVVRMALLATRSGDLHEPRSAA